MRRVWNFSEGPILHILATHGQVLLPQLHTGAGFMRLVYTIQRPPGGNKATTKVPYAWGWIEQGVSVMQVRIHIS